MKPFVKLLSFITSFINATLVLTFTLSTSVYAQTPDANDIIERSKANGKGFRDLVQQVKMVLVDADGDTTERLMEMKALTENDGSTYSLLTFTAPRREKGIALLTVAESEAADKQYLYLPSTRRTKRILSHNRNASFRGSEFTFEDLSDQSTKDYRFELKGEEACGDSQCYVLDRFPRSDESSYSRTRLWIDQTHYRLMKADFYDREQQLLKSMKTQGYRQADAQYWYPELVVMNNHQTGKSTRMESVELQINGGLKQREFTELALRQQR